MPVVVVVVGGVMEESWISQPAMLMFSLEPYTCFR